MTPLRCPIFSKCNGPQWDCSETNCRFWQTCIDASKGKAETETPVKHGEYSIWSGDNRRGLPNGDQRPSINPHKAYWWVIRNMKRLAIVALSCGAFLAAMVPWLVRSKGRERK